MKTSNSPLIYHDVELPETKKDITDFLKIIYDAVEQLRIANIQNFEDCEFSFVKSKMDWRFQIPIEARQQVIQALFSVMLPSPQMLPNPHPTLIQVITDIARKDEIECFNVARSKNEYVDQVNKKIVLTHRAMRSLKEQISNDHETKNKVSKRYFCNEVQGLDWHMSFTNEYRLKIVDKIVNKILPAIDPDSSWNRRRVKALDHAKKLEAEIFAKALSRVSFIFRTLECLKLTLILFQYNYYQMISSDTYDLKKSLEITWMDRRRRLQQSEE